MQNVKLHMNVFRCPKCGRVETGTEDQTTCSICNAVLLPIGPATEADNTSEIG